MRKAIRLLASRLPSLAFLGVAFASCNLFNPSGSGSYPIDEPDAFIDLGQRALQRLDYGEAWTNFSKALELDSTKSLAYHGLAKAEMGREGFSLATLVWLGDSIQKIDGNSSQIDFVTNLGVDTLNRIYRPLMKAAEIYRKFQTRSDRGDIDDAFAFRLVKFELEAISSSQVYFRMIDANGNWVIEPGEMRTLRMLSKIAGSGTSSLDPDSLKSLCKIATDGSADPEGVSAINGILGNLATLTGAAATTLPSNESDSNSATSQVSRNATSFLAGLESSTTFYLVNDSLDNDGDGCINEEIAADSLDNDGDSLKEEDGRLGYQASRTPVAGQISMVSPIALSLKHLFDGDKNRLEVVARSPDDLRWSNTEGLLAPYQAMRWVRWDESSASGNDTVFARVVQTETKGAFSAATVATSPDYEKIRSKAIIEIRKKVLNETDATKRVKLGKTTVGGCWDAL